MQDKRRLPSKKQSALSIMVMLATTLWTPLAVGAAEQGDCSALALPRPDTTPIDCFTASVRQHNVITLMWRVRDAASFVYISNEQAPAFDDPGYQRAYCKEQPDGSCAIELTKTTPGYYRWSLAVATGDRLFTASADAYLSPLPSPQVIGGGFVDALRPASQQFGWDAPAPVANRPYWVEVKLPRINGWLDEKFPPQGAGATYLVAADNFQRVGEVAYAVRSCFLPVGSTAKFCSPAVTVGFNVSHDHFKGTRNRHQPTGEPLVLAFTERSGDQRDLTLVGPGDEGTVLSVQAATSPVEVRARLLSAGHYLAILNSCALPEGSCSDRQPAARAPRSGVFWQGHPGHYREGDVIGTLHVQDREGPLEVRSTLSGDLQFAPGGHIRPVTEGYVLAYRVDVAGDMLSILVGAPTQWETARPYRQDFEAGKSQSMLGFGQPLDITFDGKGGVWMLNEFSNGIEHLAADGTVSTIAAPLARVPSETDEPAEGQAQRAVRPFTIAWQRNLSTRSTVSPLAEKITLIDGRLWFTQGGALSVPEVTDSPNASRVILFDPAAVDSPQTPEDDRFCVYNMPFDSDSPQGNQQVLGIASARGRIWVAESRGLTSASQSRLSSFVPRPDRCVNRLNFEDPTALAEQPLQYCNRVETPEQDGCVETVLLPDTDRPIKISHLQADPDQETLYFTDASGQFLGSYDLTDEDGFTLYPLQEIHRGELDTVAGLGGFLWDIQVTDSAVYAAEYATRHILRFDTRRKRFDEISIPFEGRKMRLHSLAVDHLRKRLWFTLANECMVPGKAAHSTIGYVDLDSWEDYLEAPASRRIRGVTYSGLEAIPQCDMKPGTHQSFRGIAVEATTGRIALATMHRGQFTLLTPLPGFWP